MSNDTTTEAPTYAKGSWQEALQRSSTMLDRSAKARKLASSLLWKGAVEGISEWLGNSDTDANGEGLYGTLLEALGTSRKGDASKIKTVALAVKNNGLDLAAFENLAKAYGEATRLTKTVRQEASEDDAAEEAIANIEAPKSTSSVDGAAALLLSKGVDGAVVAILDALGKDNFDAHRAFMRAVSNEINHRVQAVKDAEAKAKAAEAKAKKEEADKARAEKKAEAEAARKAAAKDKKATAKKTAAKKATAKPATTKAKPAKAAPVEEPEAEEPEAETPAPTTAKPKRAVPVRRR